MNFEELKSLWDNQTLDVVPLSDDRTLLNKVKADSRAFETMIRNRDRRELRAGLKFMVLFCVAGVIPHRAGVVWPFFAAAGCMLFVSLFLFLSKNLAARPQRVRDDTLIGGLVEARDKVKLQVWLLRHVTWWYVFPAQTGWWLFGQGVALNVTKMWPMPAYVVAMGLWTALLIQGAVKVYRLNQNAVRNDLLPKLNNFDDLIATWRLDDPNLD